MTVVVAVVAGLLAGALITLVARPALTRRGASLFSDFGSRTREVMPADRLLELLPAAAVLLDTEDTVRLANSAAAAMGVVQGDRLDSPDLTRMVHAARRTGAPQREEFSFDRGGFPRRTLIVDARAERLENDDVALVVDDVTQAKRVESVRRDFVANVGHEIKTPVGALQLLAEAALDARDDVDAVRRFVGRMHHEAQRLSRLVQELLDLSRLQGAEPPADSAEVPVDRIVDEAMDRARLAAESRRIALVRSGPSGTTVLGVESQLVTALTNLLDNAVTYSPEGTNVAVTVQRRDDVVEMTVSDQGIGIARDDQQRIFERFYRVDPARSRETGGTGLGLAIVKHVVGNHGGEISVWSRPGSGSTFTIRLAAAPTRQEALIP